MKAAPSWSINLTTNLIAWVAAVVSLPWEVLGATPSPRYFLVSVNAPSDFRRLARLVMMMETDARTADAAAPFGLAPILRGTLPTPTVAPLTGRGNHRGCISRTLGPAMGAS